MVKMLSQIKNMVVEYLTEEHRPFEDITSVDNNPDMEFVLKVGTELFPVFVYLNKNLPTRVLFDLPIQFHDTHTTNLKNKSDTDWWNIILKLNDRIATWGLDWNYEQDGKKITRLTLHDFIDVDVLSRDTFSHTITTDTVRYTHITKTISYLLSDDEAPSTNIGGTGHDGPYR